MAFKKYLLVHGGAKVEDTVARIKEKGENLVLIMFSVELMIGLRIGKAAGCWLLEKLVH